MGYRGSEVDKFVDAAFGLFEALPGIILGAAIFFALIGGGTVLLLIWIFRHLTIGWTP